MHTREKIVIIGGGFAGLQLAKTLNNKNFQKKQNRKLGL